MNDRNNIIFSETQKFARWLRWLLIFDTVMIAGILLFIMFKNPSESLPFAWIAFALLVPAAVGVLFWFCRLETQVRPDGLYVRFFPLHLRFKKFTPDEIAEYYARDYNPVLEYGGWGIRVSLINGKAYNICGSKGLQLVFKNGKKLLIGSQKPVDLAAAMNTVFKK